MAIAELIMPKLGESIMEATILKWHKNVGDTVKLDETVLDIATDKVDSEVPSTAEGVITEILFQVNDVVPIGTVIARINTGGAAATVAPVVSAAPAQPEPAPAPVAEAPVQAAAPVATPAPAPIAEAAIPYVPAAPAVELMAKPASNRFYSPLVLNIANSEGVGLSELERIPGTGSDGRVSKKDILQYVADKKAGRIPAIQQPAQQPVYYAPAPQPVQEAAVPATIPTPAPTPAPAPATPAAPAQPVDAIRPAPIAPVERFATPPVPAPVAEAPVQTATPAPAPIAPSFEAPVSTTITTAQQAVFIPAQSSGKFSDPASVVVKGDTEIIEMDRMRKLIAKHMVDSKHTSPHVTSFTEADVTNMVLWREKVKREFEQREGTKLTFTPMFLECISKVIKRFPLINCSLNGDQIIIKKDINIGMATALSTGNLIVPVIKGADQLNIVGLSKAVNGLADAARNSRLKPEDTTGGTFTLTNVGTFGSLMGTPIISQPQVAIMAVGAIKKRAVVIESAEGDTIGIRHMMYLSLSYDHRIVDGSIGASFLTAVGKEMEQWDVNKQWFHYL
ncbi:MAG TPA: dihydrolipoamide acetyltransferase family protein [Sediminibacterium sp.]|nr:dihydrolipoamide acetyltransferase family protein [Sediminibacterium sp.]